MSLDHAQLQTTLDGDTDIICRRDFAHPPAKVWRALTEPALIRQWMAVQGFRMSRCEFDPPPGGAHHFAWDGPDGHSFFFTGPVLTAVVPTHLVHVQNFNGDPKTGATIDTQLASHGSGTRMSMVMRYVSAEARAAAIASGMTDGMDQVYDKLDALKVD